MVMVRTKDETEIAAELWTGHQHHTRKTVNGCIHISINSPKRTSTQKEEQGRYKRIIKV